MNKFATVTMAGVLALSAGLAVAQEKKDEPAFSPAVIEQLDLANKLIALGDARKDPLLLIVAAKLQKSLGTEGASTPAHSTDTKDVLDRAKTLSAGRKDLIGIADDVAAQKSKGWSIDAVSGKSNYRR